MTVRRRSLGQVVRGPSYWGPPLYDDEDGDGDFEANNARIRAIEAAIELIQ